MSSEPTTPKKPDLKRQKFKHVNTPTKAAIRGIISFLEAQSILYSKLKVFGYFKVLRASGYRILKDDSSKTVMDSPTCGLGTAALAQAWRTHR
jgi:hypothetical protein